MRVSGLLQVDKKGVAFVTPACQLIRYENRYPGENNWLVNCSDSLNNEVPEKMFAMVGHMIMSFSTFSS